MSIRQMVMDVMEANKGVAMGIDHVKNQLPVEDVTREQVSSALAGLAAWSHIHRVGRGMYRLPTETNLEPNGAIAANVGSVSDPIVEGEEAQDKFFTRVGVAKNGDFLITRDSDGAAFRATPL